MATIYSSEQLISVNAAEPSPPGSTIRSHKSEASEYRLPRVNFIGIGGQKCASTWIYDILEGHPQVCLSSGKELDFFSNYWDRGFSWYLNKFDKRKIHSALAIGEVSPSYLSDTDAPKRAAQYNPDMRIILTLRNPLDRAYSNHKHNIRQGFVSDNDNLSFEAELDKNPTYVEHGFYGQHLSNWLQSFPSNQIFIVFFEEIVSNPTEVACSLYRFLGLSSDYTSPNIDKKSNESAAVANVQVALLIDNIRNVIKTSRISWIWTFLRAIGLRHLYRAWNGRNVVTSIPKMKTETRTRLAKIYNDDLTLLESLTKRSLDAWRQ